MYNKRATVFPITQLNTGEYIMPVKKAVKKDTKKAPAKKAAPKKAAPKKAGKK